MMTDLVTQHRRMTGQRMAFGLCIALALTGCGLELNSPNAVQTGSQVTATPNPTPTSTANVAPDNGPTASITGTVNGQAMSLSYVLLNTDASGRTALEFLNYDPCLWVEAHSASTFPQNFNTLIVELINVNAAPGPGVYIDVSGTNNASAMSIDPNSSFGAIMSCKGAWTGLAAGTTVTLTSIDIKQSTATGSISALLTGGGILSGTFSTTTCSKGATTTFANHDSAACSSLK